MQNERKERINSIIATCPEGKGGISSSDPRFAAQSAQVLIEKCNNKTGLACPKDCPVQAILSDWQTEHRTS